jgi:DNA-binding response OmpR family regulator
MPSHHAYIRPVPEKEIDPFEADATSPLRVLLVEDQEETAQNLSSLLRMDGFRVSRAADGLSALAAASGAVLDAVVLDVQLPDLDGFEVCRRLRADPATAGLVIVMLTGRDDPHSKLEGLGAGADDYLIKPVASRELAQRLDRLCAGRIAQPLSWDVPGRRATGEPASARDREIIDPLTRALGGVDLVLLTSDLTPDVRRQLDDCRRQLVRIGRLLTRTSRVTDRQTSLGTT